tara:strand:- start:1509 stop:2798 length:1290 start_codon:yes stop_codon:yes gene_type:complete
MKNDLIKNKLFFLLFIFPLTYIIGIAVVEVFLFIFFIFLFLFNHDKELLNKKILIVLFLFSIYVGLNAFIQIPSNLKYSSIFHFRYLLFSIAVYFFFEKYSHTKFNKNLIVSIFFLTLITLFFDSFFQFFVGKNIFGQKLFEYRVSSFFGDDLILGSFLIRLLPIIFWYLFYLRIDINLNKFYSIIFFSIYFSVIYLSGERTSFALLIGFILLSIIFISELRNILIKSTIIFSIFIILNAFLDLGKTDITHRMFNKTYKQVVNQNINSENKIEYKDDNFIKVIKSVNVFSNHHQGHLIVAKNLFQENPIFGVGPKGFRHFCRVVDYKPKEGVCSTHPHNILAQILSELGLIGLFFYLLFIIFFVRNVLIIKDKKIDKFELNSFLIISIGIVILLIPILPSGNFFNNWISSFIYFKIGLLLYSHKKIFAK